MAEDERLTKIQRDAVMREQHEKYQAIQQPSKLCEFPHGAVPR
jgi:hypothetical protein